MSLLTGDSFYILDRKRERRGRLTFLSFPNLPYLTLIIISCHCVIVTGITLTGADRVIIYDPSWNPAEDRQAVDRAFRIGQQRDVVVYRMILASSIEERMYEKQVMLTYQYTLKDVRKTGDAYLSTHPHYVNNTLSIHPFN